MPSQYEKRKAKAVAKPAPVAEPVVVQETDQPEAVLTHTAYDVYLDGTEYKIITIKYNPQTSDALIVEVKPIGRHIGLVHDNQKKALETLKKL